MQLSYSKSKSKQVPIGSPRTRLVWTRLFSLNYRWSLIRASFLYLDLKFCRGCVIIQFYSVAAVNSTCALDDSSAVLRRLPRSLLGRLGLAPGQVQPITCMTLGYGPLALQWIRFIRIPPIQVHTTVPHSPTHQGHHQGRMANKPLLLD